MVFCSLLTALQQKDEVDVTERLRRKSTEMCRHGCIPLIFAASKIFRQLEHQGRNCKGREGLCGPIHFSVHVKQFFKDTSENHFQAMFYKKSVFLEGWDFSSEHVFCQTAIRQNCP
jgi:hypothetical protein